MTNMCDTPKEKVADALVLERSTKEETSQVVVHVRLVLENLKKQ